MLCEGFQTDNAGNNAVLYLSLQGYETSVGKQYFNSLGRLKAFLSEKVPLDTGYVKYILALPYGDVVSTTHLTDF